MCRVGCTFISAATFFFGVPSWATAGVTGQCANCHTMHNSQNGSLVSSVNRSTLLNTDCVGCHSNSGTETIVQLGSTRIPIVYNTVSPPVNMLAGGNFYWVAKNGDQYGHNVRGISQPDATLHIGPGGTMGCANSCHISLALPDLTGIQGIGSNGCQGCHGTVKHHGVSQPGQPATAASGWYRFLGCSPFHDAFFPGGTGVGGIEDPDWEQNPTSAQHNIYYGGNGTVTQTPQALSVFCTGCHQTFHAPGFPTTDIVGVQVDNGGGTNPWLRHPTNYAIPNQGEFAPLFSTAYNPLVPVAKPDLTNYQAAKIEVGDQVTCVSCHRAHGSPYPDMLRWDYTLMQAHNGGSASGTGCFFCHTAKDH